MKVKVITFVVFVTMSLQSAFAGGFQLNEHNARAMAMGGAFTAISNDPSAIYFNAAGLTQMSGINFMLGTTLIVPTFSFRGVSPAVTEYDAVKQTFFPTHFFASYSYNKDLAFGIGFTSPFGLATKWDPNWVGRYLAVETNLQTFTISPVVAYNLLDNLSVSAGLIYSFANVTISQKTPQTPFAGDAFTTLTGKDNSAWGFNFGALYRPTEDLSLGVSFHSQVKYKFKGTATTTGAAQLASQLPNGSASANLTTPINLAFGVAYKVIPELLLSADFQYVGWSSYDSLTVNFSSPQKVVSSPRLYDNSYIIRFGAEYGLTDDLKVRAGIYFDKDPVKPEYLNPSLPDANRLGFSFGLGYKLMNNFNIDAAYLFIRGSQLTVTNSLENYAGGISPFNGTYNTAANLVSLTLSYSL
ncbi:MAG: OmpP1/FadL family transporter [Ignavibacteriaceae bacterium]